MKIENLNSLTDFAVFKLDDSSASLDLLDTITGKARPDSNVMLEYKYNKPYFNLYKKYFVPVNTKILIQKLEDETFMLWAILQNGDIVKIEA